MTKAVLIIEDDENQAKYISELIKQVGKSVKIFVANTIDRAYRLLMEVTIDVFFVDIILEPAIRGDASGLKLVDSIRNIEKYYFTPVIFITTVYDPNLVVFKKLNCMGYLEKPFSPEEAKKLIKRALNYSTQRSIDSTLYFRKDGIIYPIKISDITYIESIHRKIKIHMLNNDVFEIKYISCKKILSDANSNALIQCSRNCIVNSEQIDYIDTINRYIKLKNGDKVEIGVSYADKIREVFAVE